jgi:aconitate hydratase
VIRRPDGTEVEFQTTHTMNDEQIEWFTAGSALNIIRRKHAG